MSQQDEIKSHLKQVLTEVLEWNKEIDLNLSFYHAGGDSLSAQVLISLIQQHYSVLISHGQLDSFEDMGTLVNYVASSAGDLASEKLPEHRYWNRMQHLQDRKECTGYLNGLNLIQVITCRLDLRLMVD